MRKHGQRQALDRRFFPQAAIAAETGCFRQPFASIARYTSEDNTIFRIEWIDMNTIEDARASLDLAWHIMLPEMPGVLGGELHYQAMVYHALRSVGVPINQIGMNVKQWIAAPQSGLFRQLSDKKHIDYRGGFEPIPDVVLFRPDVAGDWRRRNRDVTLRTMLMAIEVKASERAGGRLSRSEIARDILKLAAHREEVVQLGAVMEPVMMVIDVAPLGEERMRTRDIDHCRGLADAHQVVWRYLGQPG